MTDVLVIGGGVIGCALAYYLRQHQVTVTVMERDDIGDQASGAAAGLLAPLGPLAGPGPFADLVLAGFARFPAVVTELEEMTGLHLGYQQTGALRVVRNPKRIAHLQKRWERWQPLGLQLFWLSGAEASKREPYLAEEICAAVYAPQEAQVDAKQITRAFAQAALHLGAHIRPHQAVVDLIVQKRQVVGVRTTDGETLACGTLIVASGAWAGQWSTQLEFPFPVEPLHGQLLSFPQLAPPLRLIVFGEGAYLIPREERILVGATREARGFDRAIDPQGTSWLTTTAAQLVPQMAESRVEAIWTGLRPKTPDTRPILGKVPGWENVFVAAGHNSIGILLSAITGQYLAELVLTQRMHPLLLPFTPDRFT